MQAVIPGEEIAPGLLAGRPEALIVPQRLQALANRTAFGNGLEIRESDFVLRFHPGRDLFGLADIILQPAIGVDYGLAVKFILDSDGARLRINDLGRCA